MTEKLEIYTCNICGNVVQVLLNGIGELVCCGETMEHLCPQFKEDELGEKHVPEIIEENGKKLIQLKKHPMSEEHYIQFIEAISNDSNEIRLKYLHPNQIAEFDITNFDSSKAIELCNIHKLWRNN
jgi:superoxide reductase